jgi:hypothetical protein
MTKHVRDKQVGLHRKRPHLIGSGRSALHPFEGEEPPKRSRHRDHGAAHDIDVAVTRAKHSRAKNRRT